MLSYHVPWIDLYNVLHAVFFLTFWRVKKQAISEYIWRDCHMQIEMFINNVPSRNILVFAN